MEEHLLLGYNSIRKKEGAQLFDYVDRLVVCGMNLVDAYDIVDDVLYDGDYQGLADYVRTVELESGEGVYNVD